MASLKIDDVRDLVSEVVSSFARRRASRPWWRKPLVAYAPADSRFQRLKDMAASDHLLPWELLRKARTVIVFFVPFAKFLPLENRPGSLPSRSWGVAYVETNELISTICETIKGKLEALGKKCETTPPTHNFDPVRLQSRWSHKHLGFLCGLGKFGHNAQLITPSGCAGRLGSLVTEAEIQEEPPVEKEEACLHKAGLKCLKCVKRCPVGALTEDGLDRKACWERLQFNRTLGGTLDGLPPTTHVCGKCVSVLPCSFHDPVARMKASSRKGGLAILADP